MRKVFLIGFLMLLCSKSNAQSDLFGNFKINADIGYTTSNFASVNIGISKNSWYYGFSAQINCASGVKGKTYDGIINWDNKLDGVSESGNYYAGAYGFDLGYFLKKNICLGGGLGYSNYKKYRNFHDDYNILSSDGWYHVTKGDGGKIDAKIFSMYYFKSSFYIKAQYSIITKFGASVGLTI